jgi:hypothetical protein
MSAADLFFFGSFSNSRSVRSWWALFDRCAVGLLLEGLFGLLGIRTICFQEPPVDFLVLSTWAKIRVESIGGPFKMGSTCPGGIKSILVLSI